MFRQVKSALFWYYLYRFRRRVILIVTLLLIAIFANAIYSDVVEYLTLKNKLEYLELALIAKWGIILFNIILSLYLILTLFKNNQEKVDDKSKIIKNKDIIKNNKSINRESKLTPREKEFLNKELNNKADFLVKR